MHRRVLLPTTLVLAILHRSVSKELAKKVLEEIKSWIGNTKTPLFWLNGVHGAGKSTLVQTVAEHCASQNILGASSFFSGVAAGRGPRSIAYQLLHAIPQLKDPVEAAVKKNPAIPFGRPSDQF